MCCLTQAQTTSSILLNSIQSLSGCLVCAEGKDDLPTTETSQGDIVAQPTKRADDLNARSFLK